METVYIDQILHIISFIVVVVQWRYIEWLRESWRQERARAVARLRREAGEDSKWPMSQRIPGEWTPKVRNRGAA